MRHRGIRNHRVVCLVSNHRSGGLFAVGTRIPRDVHFVVLPEEIVRIVPQYLGFDYFLVEDEIVIVDPRTLEIVAIIPA